MNRSELKAAIEVNRRTVRLGHGQGDCFKAAARELPHRMLEQEGSEFAAPIPAADAELRDVSGIVLNLRAQHQANQRTRLAFSQNP